LGLAVELLRLVREAHPQNDMNPEVIMTADSSSQQTVAALVGSIKALYADLDHRLRKIEAQRSMIGRDGLARIWWDLIQPSSQPLTRTASDVRRRRRRRK
jgi:hypothetical protein